MQQLSLDAVRMFVTVHDFGGYAKAGEVIGRSQPAISLQIKKLETQLGKKLFTKSGQRHVLSLDGEWFLTQARELLALNVDKVLLTSGCWVSKLNKQILILPSLGNSGLRMICSASGTDERARGVTPKPCCMAAINPYKSGLV